jgi:3-methyl-2-oxobutanoate hydroxymethyltransferase
MMDRKTMTIAELLQKKRAGRKITMMTAYDDPTGRLVDEAGMDMILVVKEKHDGG